MPVCVSAVTGRNTSRELFQYLCKGHAPTACCNNDTKCAAISGITWYVALWALLDDYFEAMRQAIAKLRLAKAKCLPEGLVLIKYNGGLLGVAVCWVISCSRLCRWYYGSSHASTIGYWSSHPIQFGLIVQDTSFGHIILSPRFAIIGMAQPIILKSPRKQNAAVSVAKVIMRRVNQIHFAIPTKIFCP